MGRKVSVGLEADVAAFIRPVVEATKTTEKLDDKIKDLDDSLKKIPADAAKAGAAMKLLGGDVGAVGDKIGSLGDKQQGLAILDSKIRQTKSEVKKLADEFVKTGDIDVFRKLGDAQGHLRSLEAVRKKLKDALVITPEESKGFFKGLVSGAKELGTEFGKNFSAGLQGVLSNPVIGAAISIPLAAAIVAAMSFAGAAIGGAVLLGLGAAAAGGGLAGAWMGDPEKYAARWARTIDSLQQRWVIASAKFSGPLEDTLKEVDRIVRDLPIERILAVSQAFVAPLVQGLGGGITNLANGIADALAKVQPVIDNIGPKLANLGNDLGDAFRIISEGSEGGALALGDLVTAIGWAVKAVSVLILGFERAYKGIRDFETANFRFIDSVPVVGRVAAGVKDSLFDIGSTGMVAADALQSVGDAATSTTENLADLMKQINATKLSVDSLAGAMVSKIFAATMGLDQALLGVDESLTRLHETFEKNGKAIDKHTGLVARNTEKGQANREGVLASVTANMQLYQAQIGAGMKAEDAAKNYDNNTAALERNLRKAGLNAAQIDDLIGKYRGIPDRVNTEIAINGLTSAINGLADLIRMINGIHDKTVTVYYRTKGQSLNAPLAHGGIRRAQAGMIIPPSDPGTTLVGEPQTGGEALIPLKGISQAAAMGLMRTAGAGYGISVSAGGGSSGPVQVVLSLQMNPSGRSAGIGPLVQQAFLDETIQVYANGQRVTPRP